METAFVPPSAPLRRMARTRQVVSAVGRPQVEDVFYASQRRRTRASLNPDSSEDAVDDRWDVQNALDVVPGAPPPVAGIPDCEMCGGSGRCGCASCGEFGFLNVVEGVWRTCAACRGKGSTVCPRCMEAAQKAGTVTDPPDIAGDASSGT